MSASSRGSTRDRASIRITCPRQRRDKCRQTRRRPARPYHPTGAARWQRECACGRYDPLLVKVTPRQRSRPRARGDDNVTGPEHLPFSPGIVTTTSPAASTLPPPLDAHRRTGNAPFTLIDVHLVLAQQALDPSRNVFTTCSCASWPDSAQDHVAHTDPYSLPGAPSEAPRRGAAASSPGCSQC